MDVLNGEKGWNVELMECGINGMWNVELMRRDGMWN
jgi:hypothetical protein